MLQPFLLTKSVCLLWWRTAIVCFLFRLFFGFGSVMVNPAFIDGYEAVQKVPWIAGETYQKVAANTQTNQFRSFKVVKLLLTEVVGVSLKVFYNHCYPHFSGTSPRQMMHIFESSSGSIVKLGTESCNTYFFRISKLSLPVIAIKAFDVDRTKLSAIISLCPMSEMFYTCIACKMQSPIFIPVS